MKTVYYISPVGADQAYLGKRAILAELEVELDVRFFFPLERHTSFGLEDAKRDLAAAFAVVADLSLERPSCYFELGVAEAIGARVALIAVNGTPLHQTGGKLPVRTYVDLAEYRSAVRQSILSCEARDT